MLAIRDFSGLQNTVDPKLMPLGASVVADNVDISKAKIISRRLGYSKQTSTINALSSYVTRDKSRFFIIDNGKVYRVNVDLTLNHIGDANATKETSWDDQVNYTVSSDGLLINPDNTILDLRIPTPEPPQVLLTSGSLTPGQYQVAVTYVDQIGREGAASSVSVMQVAAGQGLNIIPTLIPNYNVRLYVTEPDGDILYFLDQSTF